MPRRLALVTVLVAAVTALGAAAPGGAATLVRDGTRAAQTRTASPSTCPTTPFTPAFDAALRQRYPGQRFSVAVHDRRDGCRYDHRPDLRLTTASVLKAEILAGLLLRAQAEGRGLTQWEHERVGPMISRSDDPSANALWTSLGGIAGMRRVDAAFGLSQTTQRSPWGLTESSARDRTRLMRLLVTDDGGPLTAASRATARRYLLDVVPSQRWGITAGLPGGSTVPMKNGFFSSQCCRWRLNSSGSVELASGGGYVITIMSDRWPDAASGIEAVEWVNRVVVARLGGRYGPFRSSAAFVEQQYGDVLGRAPTFDELVATTGRVGFVTSRGPDVVVGLGLQPAFFGPASGLLRLYDGAYDRWPTGSMFAYRMWQLRRGATTLPALAEAAARSVELTGGAVLDDAAFVELVVRRVMGWAPSEADIAYWVGRLERGDISRGGVLLAHTQSSESISRTSTRVAVAAVYLAMLERPPDPATEQYWASRPGGAGLRAMASAVLGSPEYAARIDR